MAIHVIPEHIDEILEFRKVLERLARHCKGPVASRQVLELKPEKHLPSILKELQFTWESQQILIHAQPVVAGNYDDLTEDLRMLAIGGYALDAEAVLRIARVLNLLRSVSQMFTSGEMQETYPLLSEVCAGIHDYTKVISQISKVLDDEGNVRSDASKTLTRIARDIQSVSHQCDQVFQQMIRQHAAKDWLADTLESIRNERRVLAVKAEYKRQIRGILHDQSASGKTVLIEPEEVISLNNDLFDLRAEFKAEVRKLLLELSEMLRGHIEEIRSDEQTLILLDIFQAKGALGKALGAFVPIVQQEPTLSMRKARHPLLLLRNAGTDRTTVPFDLELHPPNRILLLSGPNAGGKSILMKAVGLLQMMVQSGMTVPVAPDSTFGVFDQISVSLGDHQSLEDDLSTYSSKLAEMRACVEHAGPSSLVLIDEFGSGTDPRLGGAVAEGILEVLRKKQVYGVITTHYSELKVYAYRRRGIVNGAMVFDKDRMTPKYELSIGKPGSSYTFEIARKSGLPQEILDYASNRTADMHLRAMEDLLSDLESQKTRLDAASKQAEQRSQQLDALIKSYEKMQTDLTAQRQRMRLEQKERDFAHLSELNRELERTVRSIREEKNAEAAKKKIREVRNVKEKTRDEIGAISNAIKTSQVTAQKPFAVGDSVRVHNGTSAGKIEALRKGVASVVIGHMRLEIPVAELVHAGEPLDIRTERSVRTDVDVQSHFDPKLDLRGMRPGDAEALLERFMDMAMMANPSSVQIVHGKGTGALRKMVHAKLREYPVRIEAQEDEQGGSGQTIALF